jgi:hypothetical protein
MKLTMEAISKTKELKPSIIHGVGNCLCWVSFPFLKLLVKLRRSKNRYTEPLILDRDRICMQRRMFGVKKLLGCMNILKDIVLEE